MREYIFHGKRKYDGEWVEGCLIHQGDHYLILQDESKLHTMDVPYIDDFGCIDGRADPVIPESVGLYTGMKDKNGRKIFEGNIVNCITSDFDGSDKYVYNFRITDIADFEQMGFLNFCNKIEIISNIHDNADLLEG